MTSLLRMLAALPVLFMPTLALGADQSVFVSCQLDNGVHIDVQIQHGNFTGKGSFSYTYSPAEGEVVTSSVAMAANPVTPWSGVGRAIWAAVSFPVNDQVHTVWHRFDRLEPDTGLEAGVSVLENDILVADFICEGGEIAPVFTLEDEMAAAGYCWDISNFEWRRTDCG